MLTHQVSGWTKVRKKFGTLLDLCVSSLRRGHANLLCIVPILSDDPQEESKHHCENSHLPKVGGRLATHTHTHTCTYTDTPHFGTRAPPATREHTDTHTHTHAHTHTHTRRHAKNTHPHTEFRIPTSFADGHTVSNAPDLFRPPKLSGTGPG
jgi:hypothetical protein